MSVIDLVMPKLGESIMEATILKWHKKPGDVVEQDETLLDIATDKVDSEVPSTVGGILAEILFKENDVVPIGAVIARIQTGASETQATTGFAAATPTVETAVPDTATPTEAEVPFTPAGAVPPSLPVGVGSPRFFSPLVLKIAQQEGISMSELETIPGTGQDGRVSKKDILTYLENRGTKPVAAPAPKAQQVNQPAPQPTTSSTTTAMMMAEQPAPVATSYSGNMEIIEMDRMRRLIAKHMVDSKHTSAHVTSFAECDVTNMVLWRNRVKKDFEQRESTKITFTPLFVEAIVKAIKKISLAQ